MATKHMGLMALAGLIAACTGLAGLDDLSFGTDGGGATDQDSLAEGTWGFAGDAQLGWQYDRFAVGDTLDEVLSL